MRPAKSTENVVPRPHFPSGIPIAVGPLFAFRLAYHKGPPILIPKKTRLSLKLEERTMTTSPNDAQYATEQHLRHIMLDYMALN